MDGLRLVVPDVEAYAGRGLVGTQLLRDIDIVGAALSHGLWQLDEEPVVVLAGQGVVGVHGLRLAPDVEWLCGGKALIVGRAYLPEGRLTGDVALESLAEDEEGIVAFAEGVSEVGAGACAVVTIMHFSIAEMEHQILFVDHVDTHESGCLGWQKRDEHQS